MQRSWLTLLVPLTTMICACSTSDSFDEEVTEYLRSFPYQLTYDFTVRFTGWRPGKAQYMGRTERTGAGPCRRGHRSAHEQRYVLQERCLVSRGRPGRSRVECSG